MDGYAWPFAVHQRETLAKIIREGENRQERMLAIDVVLGWGSIVFMDHWVDERGNLVCVLGKYGTWSPDDGPKPEPDQLRTSVAYESRDLEVIARYRALRSASLAVSRQVAGETMPRVSHPTLSYLVVPEHAHVLPIRYLRPSAAPIDDEGLHFIDLLSDWMSRGVELPEVIAGMLDILDGIASDRSGSE